MNIVLNAAAATYICFNILLLFIMLRRIYFPTKNELKNYPDEERNLDKEGVLLFIPLTLTIGLFGAILSEIDSKKDK